MTFTLTEKILGRLGRRYWLKRIDAALSAAYRAGHIDTYTLHEIDGHAKYRPEPGRGFRRKCPACFYGDGMHIGGTGYLCKGGGCRAPTPTPAEPVETKR
jgi:hypothetical protein